MNSSQVTGYIWYDPTVGFYQKGSKVEFNKYYRNDTKKIDCQIIYEMTSDTSDSLMQVLVNELNEAKRESITTKYWKIV